jgi:hypothetical protein
MKDQKSTAYPTILNQVCTLLSVKPQGIEINNSGQ